MRCSWCLFGPFLAVLSFLYVAGPAVAHDTPSVLIASSRAERVDILVRDGGHGHHSHHGTPKLELNETEIQMYHGPTPPSYYTIDWEDVDSKSRHPRLMIAHALFMSLAFFGALPVGESALRITATFY